MKIIQTEGKVYLVYGLEELIFFKKTMLSKAIHIFNAIPMIFRSTLLRKSGVSAHGTVGQSEGKDSVLE